MTLVGATLYGSTFPDTSTRLQAAAEFDGIVGRAYGLQAMKCYYGENQWPNASTDPMQVLALSAAGVKCLISFKPLRDPTCAYSAPVYAASRVSMANAIATFFQANSVNAEFTLYQEPNVKLNFVGMSLPADQAFRAMWAFYAPAVKNPSAYSTGGGGSPAILVFDPAVNPEKLTLGLNMFSSGGSTLNPLPDKIVCDHYCTDALGANAVTPAKVVALADAHGLPFGIWEWGMSASKQRPTTAQFLSWSNTWILGLFLGRINTGKPNADLVWYDAGAGANAINSSTDPRVITQLQVIYDALTAGPPPPPPPPTGPPVPTAVSSVTYGPLGALDAVMAAAGDAQGSAWPSPPTHYVAFDPQLGTVLMPNPQTIPVPLTLQGSPPLQVPGATSGQTLVSDNAGNFTPGPVPLQLTPTGLITTSYSANPGDFVIANPTTTLTVTLPPAPANGTIIAVKLVASSAGSTCVISRSGSDTIEGIFNSITLTAQFMAAVLQYNASNAVWYLSSFSFGPQNASIPAAYIPGAASANFQPANPAATVSTTLVMMGLGSTAVFTPSGSGKVRVDVTGQMGQQTAAQINTLGARYGTGTAPANGVPVTGTRFGGSQDASLRPASFSATNTMSQIGFTDRLSLTPGTAYWFDLALATGAAADSVNVQNISITLEELIK